MKAGTTHRAASVARISEGTKRGLRPWRDGLNVLPQHVRSFIGRGQVHETMKPFVSDAVQLVGQYADELGGEESLTAGQRALLQKLFRATVALNASFSRLLREGLVGSLGDVSYLLGEERAVISALGLDRAARNVETLDEYVAATAQNGAGAPIDVQPEDGDSGDA